MANTCKTCKRDDVNEINKSLVNQIPLWKIVARFDGLSLGGLHRHKDICIERLFAEVREQRRAGLLQSVDEVKREIVQLQFDFPENPNVRLGVVGRMLEVIDKEAKLTGAYTKERDNPVNDRRHS